MRRSSTLCWLRSPRRPTSRGPQNTSLSSSRVSGSRHALTMIRRSSLRHAEANPVPSHPGLSGADIVVQNGRRRRVRLDRRIGGGGEAEVYQLRGRSKVLAKVYRAAPSPDYRTKLEWMLHHPPTLSRRTQHVAIAWPTGLLFDGTMDLVGFLMPGVDAGLPLITAFNPRRR